MCGYVSELRVCQRRIRVSANSKLITLQGLMNAVSTCLMLYFQTASGSVVHISYHILHKMSHPFYFPELRFLVFFKHSIFIFTLPLSLLFCLSFTLFHSPHLSHSVCSLTLSLSGSFPELPFPKQLPRLQLSREPPLKLETLIPSLFLRVM